MVIVDAKYINEQVVELEGGSWAISTYISWWGFVEVGHKLKLGAGAPSCCVCFHAKYFIHRTLTTFGVTCHTLPKLCVTHFIVLDELLSWLFLMKQQKAPKKENLVTLRRREQTNHLVHRQIPQTLILFLYQRVLQWTWFGILRQREGEFWKLTNATLLSVGEIVFMGISYSWVWRLALLSTTSWAWLSLSWWALHRQLHLNAQHLWTSKNNTRTCCNVWLLEAQQVTSTFKTRTTTRA